MDLVCVCVCVEGMRYTYRILIGKPEGMESTRNT